MSHDDGEKKGLQYAVPSKPRAKPRLHDWVPSTLGHGESMCSRCLITNREAAVLGKLNECDK